MKVFNIVFVLLFIVAAALQYNDPDPYVWVPIYLYGAFICLQAWRKKYNAVLFWIGLIGYASYAFYLFFDKTGVLSWFSEHEAENIAQSMKATKPWVEETREFGGLLMLITVLVVNMIWLKKNRKKNTHNF